MTDGGLMSDEDEARDRFRSIYEANYPRLVGYAMRRASTSEDAADAVAETFLVAWRRLDQVPDGEAARLWLYGTARRALSNQRRSTARRSALVDRIAAELATMTASSPDTSTGELAVAVRALECLSVEDRDVLGLVAWEGLAGAELAVVLGCSANAAKIRVHRARRRFARALTAAALEDEPAARHGHPEPAAVLPRIEETR